MMPEDIDYGNWRVISKIELEDRYAYVFGSLTENEVIRDDFLQGELKLTKAFLLIKSLDECKPFVDEVIFYQRVRKQINKTLPGRKTTKQVDSAIKDLVDDSIDSEGVVDIYEVAGLEKPDISILDDNFLQTYTAEKYENLRLKLLEQLLNDEIKLRKRKNTAKAKSFQVMLEKTIQKYHNRIIDAAKVIEELLHIKQEMDAIDKKAEELGLSEEEYAFYSAVAENYEKIYKQKELCEIIHEVVKSLKRNLMIDWTEPHRNDIRAGIISAVKSALRKTGVKREHRKIFVDLFMNQAEELYKNWPNAA